MPGPSPASTLNPTLTPTPTLTFTLITGRTPRRPQTGMQCNRGFDHPGCTVDKAVRCVQWRVTLLFFVSWATALSALYSTPEHESGQSGQLAQQLRRIFGDRLRYCFRQPGVDSGRRHVLRLEAGAVQVKAHLLSPMPPCPCAAVCAAGAERVTRSTSIMAPSQHSPQSESALLCCGN